MVELDIIVDKWGCLDFQVIFDRKEHDWTLEDRGIEVMSAGEVKVIQTDRDDSGNGSHV